MTKARDLASGGFGLVLIKPSTVVNGTDNGKGTVSFSAASSVSLNGVFTSTYTNYKITLNVTAVSTPTSLNIRMRKAGADTLGTAYRGIYSSILGGTQTITSHDAQNGARLTKTDTVLYGNFSIDILNPISSGTIGTTVMGSGVYASNSDREIGAFGYATAIDTFDGFTLFPAAGTISGIISVYGYNK